MAYFEFLDYVVGDKNFAQEWLDGQDDQVAANFRSLINYLANSKPGEWKRPYTDKLRPPHQEIRELRSKHNRVQYRLLAFDGPGQGEVTIVAGATEKDRKFVPRGVEDIALGRKRDFEHGVGDRVIHE